MSIPTVLDRFPTPPCAITLALDICEADRDAGRVRIQFIARPEFCNGSGNIQGGFLVAMLDDCMGPALLIASDAEVFPTTIDLHVQFLAPARPGKLFGEGRVVHAGKTIGFLEGALTDPDGRTIARATAGVRITPIDKALARPQRSSTDNAS